MPLPIIILLERHWDVIPKKVLVDALPFLKASGYDTLCFESPSDINEQETITNIESTIKFIEDYLAGANQCLSKHGIFVDLPAMNYSELQRLLLNYVTTRYSNEMATWFKELPGHKEKLDLVKLAQESNIKICGIDLTRDQLEPIISLESQTNLGMRVSAIKALDHQRTLAFKKNVLELQQQGKGVIFVVGDSHYKPLVAELAKEYLLEQALFLHPHALKCLDNSCIDYHLPSFFNVKGLTLLEQAILNRDDIEMFSKNLQTTVQAMLDNSISIDPTSTCKLLSNKTQLEFEAYVRPGYLVDCYHFCDNRQTIADTVTQLHAKGVGGFFTFFKNKEAYCVPSINTDETASQIQKMDL
ncbi:MAG: hypothetical protein JJT82_07385 [Legionellaceae bacterium]|nr:hypothetical protein [Legionellaceae bacterium]